MRLRQRIEYAALRAGVYLVDHLPFAVTDRIAIHLADLWYWLASERRRIACENVRRAGIAGDPREAARIARHSFRHLLLLVAETLQAGRTAPPSIGSEQVRLDVPDETLALLNDPAQGVILASGHLGSWEMAARLVSALKPVTGIARPLNNPLSEQLLQQRKPADRFTLSPMHDTDSGRLLEVLRRGEILALLVDQNARRRGMILDFFGIPASHHTTHALLHLVTGTPLVFGYCVRSGPRSFRLIAGPPIRHRPTGDREADVRAIVEQINRSLEAAIRKHPEQYLWVHRRWRFKYAVWARFGKPLLRRKRTVTSGGAPPG